MEPCNVCGVPTGAPIYSSAGETSITSLCHVLRAPTVVQHCAACGHLQTRPLPNLSAYYDREYDIALASEDEDDLCVLADKRKVFRCDHQAETLLRLVDVPRGAYILDYGCAKGATLRNLLARRTDLVPHLFDVSSRYVPFWEKFARPGQWASYQTPVDWAGRFDVVTSFFALEHVAEPTRVARGMAELLRDGGVFYGIVPDTYANVADFVVADHINHFSPASLTRLLHDAGLGAAQVFADAHPSALVFRAVKGVEASVLPPAPPAERVADMAAFWQGFGRRVRAFEEGQAEGEASAVYGCGFYGTFITTCLKSPERVSCYVDRNPFRQGRAHLGRQVVGPEKLPADVRSIYVGINPHSARAAIEEVECWKDRHHSYLFL